MYKEFMDFTSYVTIHMIERSTIDYHPQTKLREGGVFTGVCPPGHQTSGPTPSPCY